MQVLAGLCVDSTNCTLTFLDSLHPLFLPHILLALVQPLHRASFSREFARISIDGIIRRYRRRRCLQTLACLCVDCTNCTITFLDCLHPQLLPHILLALVQPLHRASFSREFARISIDGITRRCRRRKCLQARSGLFVDCTN